MLRSIAVFFSIALFLTACQTGNSNLDGSYRLKQIGVTANVALESGMQHCASKGKNFEGAIDALRSAGYTIKEPKNYSSKTETVAFEPQNNINFTIIDTSSGRRICKIQFRYNSGISSLPKSGPVKNGKTNWSLQPLDEKFVTDLKSSPLTTTRARTKGSGNENVYTATGNVITGKTFVHPDGFALGVLSILPTQ